MQTAIYKFEELREIRTEAKLPSTAKLSTTTMHFALRAHHHHHHHHNNNNKGYNPNPKQPLNQET